jgi:hypothetical protein
MLLLDLPPELFAYIVYDLVQDVCVYDAHAYRATCSKPPPAACVHQRR